MHNETVTGVVVQNRMGNAVLTAYVSYQNFSQNMMAVSRMFSLLDKLVLVSVSVGGVVYL